MTDQTHMNTAAPAFSTEADRHLSTTTYRTFHHDQCRIRVIAREDGALLVSLVDVIVALDHIRCEAEGWTPSGFVSSPEMDDAYPSFVLEDAMVAVLDQEAGEAGQRFLFWYHVTVRCLPEWGGCHDAETDDEMVENAIIVRAIKILQSRIAAKA